ncbi:hypothetical protein RAA17_17300 [Komagataeibacter rhaeticus]|nr:hypothetical protein [Komagataeibacter rhaeticus]
MPRHDRVVTHVVTARTGMFRFVRPFHGEILPHAGTVVAHDGGRHPHPYPHCMLVMPNLRPARGHTAVRLARVDAGMNGNGPAS